MAIDFKARLRGMQDAVASQMESYVPGQGGGKWTPPDEDYTFRVTATMDESKDSKKLKVLWKFTVAEGEYQGKSILDGTMIEDNEVGLNICRGRIDDLFPENGWPPLDNLPLLVDMLEHLTNAAPLVEAKTVTTPQKDNPKYNNTRVYINQVLEPITDFVPSDDQGYDDQGSDDQGSDTSSDDQGSGEVDYLNDVLAFCASQGIPGVTADYTVEEIVEALTQGGFKFKSKQLTEEEVELLNNIGAAGLIEVEKKKPLAIPPKKTAPTPPPKKPLALGKGAAKAPPAKAPVGKGKKR